MDQLPTRQSRDIMSLIGLTRKNTLLKYRLEGQTANNDYFPSNCLKIGVEALKQVLNRF